MNVKIKLAILAFSGILMTQIVCAQRSVPLEIISSMHQANDTNLLQYARHKQLPAGYEKETLEALSHFPELKNVMVKFRIKKSLSTLKTKPTFVSMFLPKKHRT
ncbi:MAG: hypothetical protein ABJB86_22145, partial [Bacteroidota bacterium]